MITDGKAPAPAFLDAIARVAVNDSLDPAFRSLALALPSEDDMAQTLYDAGTTPDPVIIHDKREALLDAMANHLRARPAGALRPDGGPRPLLA